MKSIRILGMMSGSSLDGMDLALCHFRLSTAPNNFLESWEFESVKTIPYPSEWINRLVDIRKKKLADQFQLDTLLGTFYGYQAHEFLQNKPLVQAIAVHGHTTIHQPDQGFSFQLGAGASIAAITQVPVITQLRDADILAGGQGAPLAPLADQFLFPGYDAYLNIGGISNIYIPNQGVGFDTGAANQLLNKLAQQLGKNFDDRGQIAASGKLLPRLFEALQKPDYFQQQAPKSLSNQWVQEDIWPLIEKENGSVPDKLHTLVAHISWHISKALDKNAASVLVTGGGAYNTFLLQMIEQQSGAQLVVPESRIIDYKEAALVALVGLFRLQKKKAPLHQLTGAKYNAIPGALYLPPSKRSA